MRDDPSLRERPVAVGARPEQRGVVATCNYAARRFGVHSAMPMGQALRLCPDLVIVPTDIEKYRAVSRAVRAIFERYTPLIEPLSLDEAYLDVSAVQQHRGSATAMARSIRNAVRDEVGITISAGIAPNKFLAKIASDWRKPDGQFTIAPAEVSTFVHSLPVDKLFGVGSVTAQRMFDAGHHTCGDLQSLSQAELTHLYGKFGIRLFDLCRGIDPRPVRTHRERKSLSVERTYAKDLPGLADCLNAVPALHAELQQRLAAAALSTAISGCFIKVRFDDFTTTTVANSGRLPSATTFVELLRNGWQRRRRPVRLLGLGVRLHTTQNDEQQQLQLFPNETATDPAAPSSARTSAP